jgi:ferredoxin
VQVQIDGSRCQGHGRCVLIAPDYFDVDETGLGKVLVAEIAPADAADLREARHCCPENAIELVE